MHVHACSSLCMHSTSFLRRHCRPAPALDIVVYAFSCVCVCVERREGQQSFTHGRHFHPHRCHLWACCTLSHAWRGEPQRRLPHLHPRPPSTANKQEGKRAGTVAHFSVRACVGPRSAYKVEGPSSLSFLFDVVVALCACTRGGQDRHVVLLCGYMSVPFLSVFHR